MGFLLFVFTLAGWAYLYNRLRNAEDRLNEEQYERSRNSEIIAELTRRVWALENLPQTPPVESPAPQLAQEPAPFTPLPAVVIPPPPVIAPLPQPEPLRDSNARATAGNPNAGIFPRARACAAHLARSTARIHGRPGMGGRSGRELAQQAGCTGAGDWHRTSVGIRIHACRPPRTRCHRNRASASPCSSAGCSLNASAPTRSSRAA